MLLSLRRTHERKRRAAWCIVLAVLVLSISCGREITGPHGARFAPAAIAIVPMFRAAPGQHAHLSSGVPFEKVRILLVGFDGSTRAATVFPFPSTADSVAISIAPIFGDQATEVGEQMVLSLQFINAAADTVFRSGPDTLLVRPASGRTPSAPVAVQPRYVGPGAEAVRVALAPVLGDVLAGASLEMSATALDAQDVAVPSAPILFSSSDTTFVRFADPRVGVATIGQGRGTAIVYASLLTAGSTADSLPITVTLPASQIVAVGGADQSAEPGATLSEPIVVRVTASDAQPVAGVSVTFAATDGGSVDPAVVLTDAIGEASAAWTLGPSVGGQTLTAAVAGLNGSPVTFTASAVAAQAAELAFTDVPSGGSAGAPLSVVTVEARTVGGQLVTGFTEEVTIALGSNPASGILSGTLTVNAVGGIATFDDLSIDTPGAGYTLEAASGSLAIATSSPFNLSTGTIRWTNAAGGNWSVPSNWDLGRVPDAADSVIIDAGGTYTVTLNTDATVAYVTVGGATGAQTLTMTSRTVTITGQMSTQAAGTVTAVSSTFAGSGEIVNDGVLRIRASSVNVPLTNNGSVLVAGGVSTFGTVFAAEPGSLLRLQGDGSIGTASLTIANGLTNHGAINFAGTSNSWGATLTVTGGALVNAVDGTITSLVEGLAPRIMNALLVNEGALSIEAALTLSASSGVHRNRGTVSVVGGGLTVSGGADFTNEATLTVAPGVRFAMVGGALQQDVAATLNGSGTMALTNVNASLASGFTLDSLLGTGSTINIGAAGDPGTLAITLANSTLTGPQVTVAQSTALFLRNSAVTAPLVVEGTLRIQGGTSSISGALTTTTSSTILLQGDGSTGVAALTVANGFTNRGMMDFAGQSASWGGTLTVTAGVLENALGATIRSSVIGGAARSINAEILNAGTITIEHPITFTRASGTITNEGTIALVGGNLTIGGGLSFSNAGSVSIPTGRRLVQSAGALQHLADATLAGGGTLDLTNVTAALVAPFTLDSLLLRSSTVSGPGVTIPTGTSVFFIANSGISAPLTLEGVLRVRGGNSTLSGALTMAPSGVLSLQGDGSSGSANLTVANGFVNTGSIFLAGTSASWGASVTVTTGVFENAAGGTITSLAEGGAARTINAEMVNNGTITIEHALTISRASGTHVNNGSIVLTSGDLAHVGGAGLVHVALASVTVPTGRRWSYTGGSFVQEPSASITGGGTMAFTNTAASFGDSFALDSLVGTGSTIDLGVAGDPGLRAITLFNSTITGPGLTIPEESSVSFIANSGISSPVALEGSLRVRGGNATLSGVLTTTPTSTIHLQGDGSQGIANLTVASGFVNNGSLTFAGTSASWGGTLTVTNGVLENSPTGTITSLAEGGAARTISAETVNNGLITIEHLLTFTRASGSLSNVGTIELTQGDLAIGGGLGLINAGTLTVPAGRRLVQNTGLLQHLDGAVLTGGGTLDLTNVTADLVAPFSLDSLLLQSSTITGPGITVPSGAVVRARTSTISAPLALAGTFRALGGVNVLTGLTTAPGSLISLTGDGSGGAAALHVASGFTNLGTIALAGASASWGAELRITTGELINAPSGTISSLLDGGATRTITGSLNNQGLLELSPGGAGTLTVTGNFANAGTVNMELGGLTAGTEYDRLAVGGTLTLDGTLNVGFFGGYVPGSGSQFSIITNTGARTGAFAETNLAVPLTPNINYQPNAVIVAVP